MCARFVWIRTWLAGARAGRGGEGWVGWPGTAKRSSPLPATSLLRIHFQKKQPPQKMIIYQDIITGDELVSDAYEP